MAHYWNRSLNFRGCRIPNKYQFVAQIPRGQNNSLTVVKLLRQIFIEWRIPKELGPGNGPHCSSQAFRDSARELGFQHVTSTVHYPRSKAFIESQVKSVKAAPLKAKTTHRDPEMVSLCLRTTPIDHKLPSPVKLILGPAILDNLPRIPRDVLIEAVAPRLEERQKLQKLYYDRSARQVPELTPGQRVSIQD